MMMNVHSMLTDKFTGKVVSSIMFDTGAVKIIFMDDSTLFIEADSYYDDIDETVEQELSVTAETIRVEKGSWSL